MGDGRAERSSAMGDGGQAAISLTPDVDGTRSGSLLDSVLSTLLKKQSSDVWVVAFFFQAEDGIRDVAVTGVQTCALPI